jgi:hypothetical protein
MSTLERDFQESVQGSDFSPVREKISLIYMNVLVHLDESTIEEFILKCETKMPEFLKNLHRLVKVIQFKDNFAQYFNLKKLQVMTKLF